MVSVKRSPSVQTNRPTFTTTVFGTTDYGRTQAHVAIGRDATFAVQFHPEKSSLAGLRLLENFINWAP
ncbi:hypothetical protein [Corynebacterium sp.]|uniref:hypothetical protein n=1 Tax=Corynebacterium sp. TaxID=1720 RepID=UPI00257A1E23|nr:hypothetical protein [Corynebacterium sp.]